MSKSRRTPPLPSQEFTPFSVSEQEMFPELTLDADSELVYRFESALSAAILETAHLYGVYVMKVDLFYYGDNVFAKMFLAAGGWRSTPTFGANRRKHPVSVLCANLLRFLRRHHEELS